MTGLPNPQKVTFGETRDEPPHAHPPSDRPRRLQHEDGQRIGRIRFASERNPVRPSEG